MRMLRLLTLSLALVLAACASAPPKRINPPQVSIQRLTTQANGDFDVELRLQNHSDVAMRFGAFDLALIIAGIDAGQLRANPDLEVAAHTAELVSLQLAAGPDAGAPLAAAAGASGKPDRVLDGEFEFENQDGKMVKVPIDATRRAEIETALARASDTAVHYMLRGKLATREPERDYEIFFESRLSPVPGIPGEFR
ncbi:MAG: hypothetical protein IPG63_11865 [Xanthomonadales bacterium]|nr:hypothetical protein [Xanthomonadales bacterium]MBK7145746.1 hypothetical protein [Xanthomonadales bacterium]